MLDLIRPLETYIKHCSRDMLQSLREQLYILIDIINDKELDIIVREGEVSGE